MNEEFVSKRFLNEFFLQLLLAHTRKRAKEVEEKPREMPKEREKKKKKEKEKFEKLPFIRPLVRRRPKPKKLKKPVPPRLPRPPKLPATPPTLPIKKEWGKETKTAEVGKLDLSKIEQLMADPSIASIECLGPNQEIKIKKDNRIIAIDSLTKEEIKGIAESISKKTKVPVSTTFKASFNGITIEAIISDLIGSRFIITKEAKKEAK